MKGGGEMESKNLIDKEGSLYAMQAIPMKWQKLSTIVWQMYACFQKENTSTLDAAACKKGDISTYSTICTVGKRALNEIGCT